MWYNSCTNKLPLVAQSGAADTNLKGLEEVIAKFSVRNVKVLVICARLRVNTSG